MPNKPSHAADHLIVVTVFALVIFGLIMISSASAIISYANFGVNDYYFWHQLGSIILGIVGWVFFQSVDYHIWRKLATPILVVSIILLVAVFIPGIGSEFGTAKSWIVLPAFGTIQPSEFAKLAVVIYLSAMYSKKGTEAGNFSTGFMPFLIVMGVVGGLIAMQPDFGTTLIIVVLAASIFFVAGANLAHILLGIILAFFGVVTIVRNTEYIFNRFIAFLNPDIDPLRTGYHIQQALIAVGSGGIWGVGFGNSKQKFEYLPEAQGDSIFAIASEELGFLRVIIIVGAFVFLAIRGFRIAERAPDKFGQLLATGITTWITFQAFINIAVVLSLFPTTGVPLPFISYGGSSLLASLAGIGILLNISKYTHETSLHRRRDRRTYSSRPRRRSSFKKKKIRR